MLRTLALTVLLLGIVGISQAQRTRSARWRVPDPPKTSWWGGFDWSSWSFGWGDYGRDARGWSDWSWGDWWMGDYWWGDRNEWRKTNCTMGKAASSISCWAFGLNVTCKTVAGSGDEVLPVGKFRVGFLHKSRRDREEWYRLYPLASDGDYYDYFVEDPDNGRSRMTIKSGNETEDSASVPVEACWRNLTRVLNLGKASPFRIVSQYWKPKWAMYQANLEVVS